MRPAPWMWQEAQCILHDAIFFDDGDAIYFHQGATSRKRGANGKPVREYPPPLMACKWRSGRKPWPPYLTEVVSHGRSLWTS